MIHDIFLFMGQSNMAGRGITSPEHPECAPEIISGAGWEYRAVTAPDRLVPATEPFGRLENREDGINDAREGRGPMKTGGPAVSFMNSYFEKSGHAVIGIAASKGGSLIAEWQPKTKYLNDTISRLGALRSYLSSTDIEVGGTYVLWCQGENDAEADTPKDVYIDSFFVMVDELKRNGVEKVFVLRIGHSNHEMNMEWFDDMMAWQDDICAMSDDVIMVSHKYAEMRERGLMKDGWHYFQQAYNEAGADCAINTAYYLSTGKRPVLEDI